VTVSFDFVIGEDGTPQYLVPNDLPLASLCTAYHIEIAEEVSKMYEIIVGDVDLSRALNELILSISTPHVSPLNCGRAMDGIKHIISGNIRDDKKAWKMMRDALQIDEPYIRFIMTNSTDPRHGRPGHITPDVTNEICRRSWIIMNRFLEYKKRNAMPLPIGDFPLLTH
jgi:hypothetical protein